MNSSQFERVREIFHRAYELDSAHRATFLDDACAGDDALRAEVEGLFENDYDGCLSLSATAVPLGKQILATTAPQSDAHPEKIAGYRIVRRIGMGGMAEVYEAEQDFPRRTVAIKVMRRGTASTNVLRRFEHEAHILGLLHHPGIAQIFEAGIAETDGRPQMFVAMELVRGPSLTEYAQAQRLNIRERLDLLARVCDAVQHAHQKGVIHRDLKPANILVEGGNPKVLDFGVARVTDADLHLTQVETDVGQLVGTLPYMSPEQVSGDPAEIDTRCDVYALGVLLFELLTGRLPNDLRRRSVPDAIRAIRDEVPPHVGTIDRSLRGDIETIVSKAVEKDKTRRYGSAAELASDLRRYLGGLPIEARRDSVLYVVRKRLERYRGTAIVAGILLALALTSMVVALIQSTRSRRLAIDEAAALAVSRQEKQRADVAIRDLTLELRTNHIERGRLLGLTGNCRTAEDLIWGEHLRSRDCAAAYWALWELYSRFPVLASLPGHAAAIRSLALSPDEHWIASGGVDGCIMLWDSTSHASRCLQVRGDAEIRAIVFSLDATRIITGDSHGQLHVWDRESARLVAQAHADEHEVQGIARVGDNRVASVGADGKVRLWTIAPLAMVDEQALSTVELNAVAVDADASCLVAGGDDAVIRSIDLVASPTGKKLGSRRTELRGHAEGIMSLTYSHDGARIASGGRDRTLRLWRMPAGGCEAVLQPANGSVRALAFSRDDRTLAEAGWWTLDLWDLDSSQRIYAVPMQGATWGVGWIGRDTLVLGDALFGSSNLRFWETQPRRCLRRISAHQGRARGVAVSSDGRTVATAGADNFVRLWSLEQGAKQREFEAHGGGVLGVRFSTDDHLVASLTNNGYLEAWDVSSGRRIFGDDAECGPNAAMCFAPDTHQLFTGGRKGECRQWDLDSGRMLAQWRNGPDEVLSVLAISRAGLVATAARNQPLQFWAISDHASRGEMKAPADTNGWTLAVSNRGERIAAGTWDARVLVWDAASRVVIADLTGHTQLVTGVSFGANQAADLLASSSTDGQVKLWDWRNSACLATLDAGAGGAADVTFTPDGRRILAAYADGTLGIWDLTYYERHIEGNRAVHRLDPAAGIASTGNP